MARSSNITEDDVRMFMLDRSAADNDLDGDLSFSSEEIADAMDRAAREYNSVPPLVSNIRAQHMNKDTNMFLDAIAQQLYISAVAKLKRNDIDYTAGGVGTNLEAKRIDHYMKLIALHGERFREAAQNIKVAQNLRSAFRHFGTSDFGGRRS
jgi:glutathionylspermidine synthase